MIASFERALGAGTPSTMEIESSAVISQPQGAVFYVVEPS
jgi:hypothetical protein